MAIPNKLKHYGYHVVIAIDQLFNALTGGAADETLSSRTYRGAILAENPKNAGGYYIVSSTVSSLIAITAKQLMKVN